MRLLVFIFLIYLIYTDAFGQNGSIIQEGDKYGIFDKNHGVILSPVCDTIISKPTSYYHTWDNRFFILKKGSKYAYAYFRNLDSLGNFGYLTPQWEISKFDYDELTVISSRKSLEFVTHLTLRYKIAGRYGLMYIRTNLFCETAGPWTFCWIDGLGELNKTEPIYNEPFFYIDDKLLHIKLEGKYRLLEFVDKDKNWINYTYNDVFDSILCYPDLKHPIWYYRAVKNNGKWGLIKIKPESIVYIIPLINESPKEIKYTYPPEVFYTEKAVNDTIFINDTEKNLLLKLNIQTCEGMKVDVNLLKFFKEITNQTRYLMIGLCQDDPNAYIFNEIKIIDNNGNIKATYNDPNAEYMLHKNQWGALIGKKTNTGKKAIHEFFDVETGAKMFTIKTGSNTIISSCELSTSKIPLVAIEPNKEDMMVGYYDCLTKKYNKNNPKKGERCYGF